MKVLIRHLTWGSKEVGMFRRITQGWLLENGSQRTPSDPATAAHDVFEHLPGESGNYWQEIRSLGAQSWIKQADPDLSQQIADAVFSIMAMTLEEGSRGIEGLILPKGDRSNAGAGSHNCPHEMWLSSYQAGLAEARSEFGAWGEPEQWNELESAEQIGMAMKLIEQGYVLAKERFPCWRATREDYQALVNTLQGAHPNQSVTIEEEGGRVRHVVSTTPSCAPARRKP